VPELPSTCVVRDNMDFVDIDAVGKELKPDILIGNSKGYGMARALDIPLVRAGFPIHDRLGGQRVLHVGYRGAQQFYDQIVNTFLARKQEKSTVGYSYL
jgi:nitrogenase molybdenum-iron protein NifN